ncbi:TA system VapC family ribonuclease toxin [Actinomycetes bacterium KLBMP 9759]
MFLLDVNVVPAAHRADHRHHDMVRSWFDDLVSGEQPFTVPMTIWGSSLRLSTNRRVVGHPTPTDAAYEFIEQTRAQPNYLQLDTGPRHLTIIREICDSAEATGDPVPDAVLAALAAEHSCIVATLDPDFVRFDAVRHLLLKA